MHAQHTHRAAAHLRAWHRVFQQLQQRREQAQLAARILNHLHRHRAGPLLGHACQGAQCPEPRCGVSLHSRAQ